MTRITKLLIANRGEIASRIIRTARTLDIKTVTVFSEPDAQARFVEEADAHMRAMVEAQIESESLPFFLSGRLYDDGVIDPRDTRTVLGLCLSAINSAAAAQPANGYGVFRV